MIVDMDKLGKEELIEMNKKAIAQISKLVDENRELKESSKWIKDFFGDQLRGLLKREFEVEDRPVR